jgi:hypothetical protein
MILNQTPSSGISAPCVDDIANILLAYQAWMVNSNLTASDLYAFLTVPSAARGEFLSLQSRNVKVVSPIFATQTYV